MAEETVWVGRFEDDITPGVESAAAAMETMGAAAATVEGELSSLGGVISGAGAEMDAWAASMQAAGLEFFTFDDAAQTFVSNMAEVAATTTEAAAGVDTVTASNLAAIPTVGQLNAQFAEMRARFLEVSAAADVEQAAMMRSARVNLENAATMKETTVATKEATTASEGLHLSFFAWIMIASVAIGAIKGIIDAESHWQAVEAQTRAVLKSTHDASKETAASIEAMAHAWSMESMFSEDAVQSAENVLLTFTNIGKNIFPQATTAVLNLAQAMREDWKTAAIQVGKALQDPATGLTNLKRIGVEFSAAQVKVIKNLEATGHMAQAQGMILQELNREFGNSAKAAGQTFGGQLAILGHHVEDVGKKLSEVLSPGLNKIGMAIMPAINGFLAWMASGDHLKGVLKEVGDILAPLGSAISDIAAQIAPLVLQFIDWAEKNDVAGKTLAVVKIAVQLLADALRFIVPIIISVIQSVIAFVAALWDRLGPGILTMVAFIRTHWTEIASIISGVWTIIVGIVKTAWALVSGIILVGIDILTGNWKKAWTDLQNTFKNIWDGILTYFRGVIKLILGVMALIPGSIGDQARATLKAMNDMTTGVKKSAIQMQEDVVASDKAMVAGIQTQLDNAQTTSQRHFLQMKLDAANQTLQLQQAVLKNMQTIADGVNTKTATMSTNADKNAEQMHKNVVNRLTALNNDVIGHSLIPDLVNGIGIWLSKLVPLGIKWFTDFMNGILNTINSFLGPIAKAIGNIASAIAGALHHSKPDWGPLANDDQWMPDMLRMWEGQLLAGVPRIRMAGLQIGLGLSGGIVSGIGTTNTLLTSILGAIQQGNAQKMQVGSSPVSNALGGVQQSGSGSHGLISPMQMFGQMNKLGGQSLEWGDRGAFGGML